MGIPPNLWFLMKILLKWMMTGGTPILGNPHINGFLLHILNHRDPTPIHTKTLKKVALTRSKARSSMVCC